METHALLIGIGSLNPERLRDFYENTVGMAPRFEMAPGAYAVDPAASPCLIIESHDGVAPSAVEPQRILLNLLVADARETEARLKASGVAFVRSTYEEPGVGLFATFADPDGNYCQLVELAG